MHLMVGSGTAPCTHTSVCLSDSWPYTRPATILASVVAVSTCRVPIHLMCSEWEVPFNDNGQQTQEPGREERWFRTCPDCTLENGVTVAPDGWVRDCTLLDTLPAAHRACTPGPRVPESEAGSRYQNEIQFQSTTTEKEIQFQGASNQASS